MIQRYGVQNSCFGQVGRVHSAVTPLHRPHRAFRPCKSSSQDHEVLLQLIPDLKPRLEQLKPELLHQLTSDPALAFKLVSLRSRFPSADVSAIILKRPSLLTDFSFQCIPAAVRTLLDYVPEDQVDALVEVQPWLLDARVGEWLDELKRQASRLKWDQLAKRSASPSMLRLTEEGMARGLLQDPNLLFRAQRGSDSLGPGAEYLDNPFDPSI